MTWPEIERAVKPIKTLNSDTTAKWLHGLIQVLPKHYLACEVGTYYGYISAVMVMSGVRTICIDHMRCGYCDIAPDSQSLYLDVIQNFTNVGVWSNIIPMPMKSLDAVELLKIMNPTIGLLYLDGDHTWSTVLKELQEFDRFIPHGGFVCGDDCTMRDNITINHPEITFNKCWAEGIESHFCYCDYGAGVSTAVWRYFRGNTRYEALQGVPGNQFGFKKIG